MFKGASESLKIEDVISQPVTIIDPEKDRQGLAEKVKEKELTALLWPQSTHTWNVVLTGSFQIGKPFP